MTKLHFRKAVPEDAFALELDDEGKQERSLNPHPDPQQALSLAIKLFPTCTSAVDDEGRVVALAGIVFGDGQASPWMLRSALADRYRFQLLRKAASAVKRMRAHLPAGAFVHNFIGKESHQARALVQRLGFRIVPHPVGPFDLFYLPNV